MAEDLAQYDRRRLSSGLRRIVEAAAEILEVARVGIWLYGSDGDSLHRVHLFHRSTGEHVAGGELRRDHFPSYFDALDDDPELAVDHVHDDPRTSELSDRYAAPLGIGAWVDVPLRARGRVAGIVRFEHLGPARRWEERELDAARGLAASVDGLLSYFGSTGLPPSAARAGAAEAEARAKTPEPRRAAEEDEPAGAPPEDEPMGAPPEVEPEDEPVGAPEPPESEAPEPDMAAPEEPDAREAETGEAEPGVPGPEPPEPEVAAGRLFESLPIGAALVDAAGDIVVSNPALARLFGRAGPEEMAGTSLPEWFVGAGAWTDLVARLEREGRVEGWEVQADLPEERECWLLLEAVPADDRETGKAGGIVLTAVDITERKHAEQKLERQANRDVLTGAANRRLLYEAAENALALADRHGRQVGILYVDLRRFKEINDRHGHAVGDRVLTHVADRLRARGRESDLTARVGGDEFVVLLSEVEGGLEGARKAADRLMEALSLPIKVDDLAIDVDVTIGVALYPDHGRDARTLLQRADEAMYRGKEAEAGTVVLYGDGESYGREEALEPAAGQSVQEQRAGEGENGGDGPGEEPYGGPPSESRLDLEWQPICRVSDGTRVGAEGFLRWNHPEAGRLRARDFVGRAEAGRWIDALDRWVVNRAAGRVAEWLESRWLEWVALNVSPVSLSSPGFLEFLEERVRSGVLAPETVLFELDLDGARELPPEAAAALPSLRDWGFGVAVDLSRGSEETAGRVLEALEVDAVEVTPAFLERLGPDGLRGLLEQGGRAGGPAVLAKKVEDEGQYARAVRMGCTLVQGRFVGADSPTEETA